MDRILLARAAQLWFATALIGQWLFVSYIVLFYGRAVVTGTPEQWNRHHSPVPNYVASDALGNAVFAVHALLAACFSLVGALQLIPWIRARAPAFHRLNGRLFFVVASGIALDGLYLVWIRHNSPTWLGAGALSLNALLIVACLIPAWSTARARRFVAHRRWALRTYLVANGQWFFRIGAYTVVLLAKPLVEPFFLCWGFGCYLVPLAFLEGYWRAEAADHPAPRLTMAALLTGCAALTGIGAYAAYMLAWRPLL